MLLIRDVLTELQRTRGEMGHVLGSCLFNVGAFATRIMVKLSIAFKNKLRVRSFVKKKKIV